MRLNAPTLRVSYVGHLLNQVVLNVWPAIRPQPV